MYGFAMYFIQWWFECNWFIYRILSIGKKVGSIDEHDAIRIINIYT